MLIVSPRDSKHGTVAKTPVGPDRSISHARRIVRRQGAEQSARPEPGADAQRSEREGRGWALSQVTRTGDKDDGKNISSVQHPHAALAIHRVDEGKRGRELTTTRATPKS